MLKHLNIPKTDSKIVFSFRGTTYEGLLEHIGENNFFMSSNCEEYSGCYDCHAIEPFNYCYHVHEHFIKKRLDLKSLRPLNETMTADEFNKQCFN